MIQLKRLTGEKRITCNARLTSRLIRKHCALDSASLDVLNQAVSNLSLSARAYDRILKVARTIADLASAPRIQAEHVAEAVQYRTLDRSLW
jgi:magnesium chelatase family protein